MKTHAPNIMWDLDLAGVSNQLILIEHQNDHSCFKFMSGKNNIIFSPSEFSCSKDFDARNTVAVVTDSVTKIHKAMKFMSECEFDFVVIDRVDMMNINLHRMTRGSLVKAYLSMLSSKSILRGANLIVTSPRIETNIRGFSNKHYTI